MPVFKIEIRCTYQKKDLLLMEANDEKHAKQLVCNRFDFDKQKNTAIRVFKINGERRTFYAH